MSKSFWQRVKGGSSPREPEGDTTAELLRKLIVACPLCRGSLQGHHYRLIASTILGEGHEGRFQELLNAIRHHSWSTLFQFQDWKGDRPNAEVFAIRCPNGGLSVSVASAPYLLEEPYMLMHQELVESGSDFPVAEAMPDEWPLF
jgi:hypothetical protein